METSYDVQIWKVLVYTGARTTTHTVRWSVAGRTWREPHKTAAHADAFRSELLTAARKGEAFSVESGRPLSMDRAQARVDWFGFAQEYVAMKWPDLAPNSRRNTARALTNATLALISSDRGRPSDSALRTAMTQWAFNRQRRHSHPVWAGGRRTRPEKINQATCRVRAAQRPIRLVRVVCPR